MKNPPVRSTSTVVAGKGWSMDESHRHCDLELNFLESTQPGRYADDRGGSRRIPPRQLFLFFGLHPHRCQMPRQACMLWAKLPLSWLLVHNPAPALLHHLLSGDFILSSIASPRDGEKMRQWIEELRAPDAHQREAARLEIEARLRRLWAEQPAQASTPAASSARGLHSALRLALHMIAHFHEPISPRDAARMAGLTPGYASECFRNAFDTTPGNFLAGLRLGEAARLLSGTNRTVIDIALSCGFKTQSVFYKAFVTRHGIAPGKFRRGRKPL